MPIRRPASSCASSTVAAAYSGRAPGLEPQKMHKRTRGRLPVRVILELVIRRLPHVDRVGIEERAATLGKRSIKTTAKQQGIRLAVSMLDLTTLEGADTPGKVRHLCSKAVCPAPDFPEIPSCAAVCVYPTLAGVASSALAGTGVKTAAVATGFPSGQVPLGVKLGGAGGAGARGPGGEAQ